LIDYYNDPNGPQQVIIIGINSALNFFLMLGTEFAKADSCVEANTILILISNIQHYFIIFLVTSNRQENIQLKL